jgi:hypothetical protein
MRPSNKSLARDMIRDYISDLRWARRYVDVCPHVKENKKYIQQSIDDLRKLISARHNMQFDQFGWPTVLPKWSGQ